MSYLVRAFCTSTEAPSIGAVLAWVRGEGYPVEVAPGDAQVDLSLTEWDDVRILYRAGKAPFRFSISHDDGTPDCLFREEVEEFEDLLAEKRESRAKRRVLKHLGESRYVVSNDLPTGDIDNEGYAASAMFLEYFVQHAGGMVQADNEGFYDGAKLLIKLD